MADPVKISELPAISTVESDYILPIVDAALTQTSKCTAGQIAAIGGGPPGDGLVKTSSLQDGAVTATKVGFTGPDKIITRTGSGSGAGVEVDCTPWARGLLACLTNNAAVSYLSNLLTFASATFTGTSTFLGPIVASSGISGQVKADNGTAASPSYSFASDPDTGIARLSGDGSLSIVSNGVEQLRVLGNGNMASAVSGESSLGVVPLYGCRAMVAFNGFNGSIISQKNVSSVQRVQQGNYNIFYSTPLGNDACATACGQARTSWSTGSAVAMASVIGSFSTYCNCVCNVYASRNGFGEGDWVDSEKIWIAAFR